MSICFSLSFLFWLHACGEILRNTGLKSLTRSAVLSNDHLNWGEEEIYWKLWLALSTSFIRLFIPLIPFTRPIITGDPGKREKSRGEVRYITRYPTASIPSRLVHAPVAHQTVHGSNAKGFDRRKMDRLSTVILRHRLLG